jgi:hypothetical protein
VATVDEIDKDPESDRSPGKGSARKFVYHPYYGFVPVSASTANDSQTYVYDPFHGYIPSDAKYL